MEVFGKEQEGKLSLNNSDMSCHCQVWLDAQTTQFCAFHRSGAIRYGMFTAPKDPLSQYPHSAQGPALSQRRVPDCHPSIHSLRAVARESWLRQCRAIPPLASGGEMLNPPSPSSQYITSFALRATTNTCSASHSSRSCVRMLLSLSVLPDASCPSTNRAISSRVCRPA